MFPVLPLSEEEISKWVREGELAMRSIFSWLPWWKPSVVVFFSSTLFDESRTVRHATRRLGSHQEEVDVEYVQVQHGRRELRSVLGRLGWYQEVIFLLHDPLIRLHDVPEPECPEGHIDVILQELKSARPLARVLIWDNLSLLDQLLLASKVRQVLGDDRILTGRDLAFISNEQVRPSNSRWHRLASSFGLF